MLQHKDLRAVGWSGRRDLNPGPLAPQGSKINHLQTTPLWFHRVAATRFGLQLDAGSACLIDLDSGGLRSVAGFHIESILWTPVLVLHVPSRAVVTAFQKPYPIQFEMDRIRFFGSLYCTNVAVPGDVVRLAEGDVVST